MATSAWLHGQSAMRLTEGLLSVLKEQRSEYIPALLSNYREHGVFPTQVESASETHVSLEVTQLLACCSCAAAASH